MVPYVFEEGPKRVSLFFAADVGAPYSDGARISPWREVTLRGFRDLPVDSPAVAFTDKFSALYWEATDFRFEIDGDALAIRYSSWNALAGASGPREHLRKYRRISGQFARVQPFVSRAQDLPDEWIRLTWTEASKLCAPGKQAELEPWHDRIRRAMDPRSKGQAFTMFESENADAERPSVTFKCDGCKTLPVHVTFHMVRDAEGYLVEAVSSSS